MNQQSALNNLVRIGKVSSVDVEKRLVRVEFSDKQDVDGKPLISGELKVLQNQPFITIEKWVMEDESEFEWEHETVFDPDKYNSHQRDSGTWEPFPGEGRKTQYNSPDRELSFGEKYIKDSYETRKDIIENSRVIRYEKRETIDKNKPLACVDDPPGHVPTPPHPLSCTICGAPIRKCPIYGIIEHKPHRQTVTVYPWLPYVGQLVVCLYLPNGDSDGVVIGGI